MQTQELEERREGLVAVPEEIAAPTLLQQIDALVIHDDNSLLLADDLHCRVHERIQQIKGLCGPNKIRWHEGHKAACAQEADLLAPYIPRKEKLGHEIARFRELREREHAEAQRKAQEEADLQEALDAEAAGNTEAAEAALNGQGTTAVILGPAVPKTRSALRYVWGYRMNDFEKFATAAVERGDFHLLREEGVALGGLARALKDAFSYPGVEAVKRRVVSAGRR